MMTLKHFAAPTAEELEAEINSFKTQHPELTETKRMEEHYPGTKSPYQAGVLFENEQENNLQHGTILLQEDFEMTWSEQILAIIFIGILFPIVLSGYFFLEIIQLFFKIVETVVVNPIFWLFDKITKRT